MPLFSRLGYLRNEVLRLPEAQLLSIVKYHSETVINRSPAGRYWGSSLSFRGKSVENKVHELQFAHRVVADKVVVHGHLMQLVWEMYGFQYAGIRDLLLENQDKIALTAAVAEAIEDRMLLIADHEVVRILLEQITQAMEDAVLELSGRSLEDIQSKGLTPYDFFFVDVRSVAVLAQFTIIFFDGFYVLSFCYFIVFKRVRIADKCVTSLDCFDHSRSLASSARAAIVTVSCVGVPCS